MKIGILLTGHAPDALIGATGDYDRFFQNLLRGNNFNYETYAVVDNEFPSGADAADAWLITGSRFGAYEPHAWIPPLEALIRDIHARGQPLVGICFGHQIIAQALGGKVEKFAGGWAVGREVYDTPHGPVAINAWHQDQVTTLPDGARVLGRNEFCENAILAYGDHILTYQAHPEFTSRFVVDLIEARGRGVVPDALLDDAKTRADAPLDTSGVAADIANVLKGEPAP